MDKAREAINKLTSGHGHHTTDVTEHYKPAVTHEQVNPTREHVDTTVVDKEVHQDHHHTSVLPIKDKEVLPTEHHHNIAPAKHSEHHHGDHSGIKDRVTAEAAQFKSHTQTAPTETTHSVAPTVAGEHHHHHVHETIQPVIQKQTIQPSVVHTTVPVHETHHQEPKHYTASALPAVSMSEFKSQGGSLSGIADRTERFEGEPENIAKGGLGSGHQGHHHDGLSGTNTTGAATTGTTGMTGTAGSSTFGSGHDSSRTQQAVDPRVDRSSTTTGHGNLTGTTSGTSTDGKPSLLQKLNPFKDADGDGKKGLMD